MTTTAAPPLLAHRGYRLFLLAQLVGASAVGVQRIAQDWLVLDLTGRADAVGLAVALQFLPMLVLGPALGVLVDRWDTRRVVVVTTASSAALATALAVLAASGAARPWHLFLLAALLGVVSALDHPSRQAFVGELVGDDALQRAVGTNNVVGTAAALGAPALTGVVIASAGSAWAFAGAAGLAWLASATFLLIRPHHVGSPSRVAPAPGQLREGFRFVARSPELRVLVPLAGAMGAFGMNSPVVLSAFADTVWDSGAAGFGVYSSLAALGSTVGAVVAIRVRRVGLPLVVGSAAGFGVTEAVTAVLPSEVAFGAGLVVVGVATMLFITSAATLAQLSAPAGVRGRVLALYSPVLLGGHACGGLLAGALTESLGVRAGLVVVGALAVASSAAALSAARRWPARPPAG